MFYISRVVDAGSSSNAYRYGVIDTEDDVEDIYTAQEIYDLMSRYRDLEIAGVETYSWGNFRIVSEINVCQPPDSLSMQQVKLHFMTGLDIQVSNGEIVSIVGPIHTDIKVRLSDYAKSCGHDVLSYKLHHDENKAATFIIDDGIKIERDSFRPRRPDKIVFDIREVTEKDALECIYDMSCMTWGDALEYFVNNIIDIPNRRDMRLVNFLLHHNVPKNVRFGYARQYFNDFESAKSVVETDFGDSFRRLCSIGVVSSEKVLQKGDYNKLLSLRKAFVRSQGALNAGVAGIALTYKWQIKFADALKICSTMDMKVYYIFVRYIKAFGGSPEFIELFNKLMVEIVDWYMSNIENWNNRCSILKGEGEDGNEA